MEISIKEQNLTVTKTIVNETAEEALDAAIDVLNRIFGETAIDKALHKLQIWHQRYPILILGHLNRFSKYSY